MRHQQPDGIEHNLREAAPLRTQSAVVRVDGLADSRGLTLMVDGHHVNGSYIIIPWATIDAERKKRDEALDNYRKRNSD